MMNRTRLSLSRLMVLIVACCTATVDAIEDHQAILLWHSGQSTPTDPGPSELIRHAYVAAHPTVHEIDLNIGVPGQISALPYNLPADMNNPAPTDMTPFHITPFLYDRFRTELLDYITVLNASQPDDPIRCFATTRGVPALIMTDFDVRASHINDCDSEVNGCGFTYIPIGVLSGFESALAMIALGSPTNDTPGGHLGLNHFGWDNPFFQSLTPLEELISSECFHPPAPLFTVSRLDATPPTSADDLDGDGQREHHEAVILAIQRTQNLTVNPYRVTIVGDGLDGPGNFFMNRAKRGLRSLRDAGWCVYYDETDEFLHGANDPATQQCDMCTGGEDPVLDHCATATGVEAAYNQYPEIFHVGFGRNHECTGGNIFGVNDNAPFCECVATTYAGHFNAHPGGVFVSIESTNGRWLWDTRVNSQGFSAVTALGVVGIQGWSGEWIARSHGGFALAHAFGPDTSVDGETNGAYLGYNFLEQGWTWGEAALSTIETLGHSDTPLGDPLARITIVIPEDVNADDRVDAADRDLVMNNQCGTPACADASACPACDVNGDGLIDAVDAALVQEVIDRIADGCFLEDTDMLATVEPLVDAPHTLCAAIIGARNDKSTSTATTLELFMLALTAACDCAQLDVNDDGAANALDVIDLLLN